MIAIGTTSAAFDPDQLDVAMNGVWICRDGATGDDRSLVDLSGRAVEIAAKLTIRFKNGEFTDGIVEAITAAGQQLKTYFPRAEGDVNELPDAIDISEE